MAAHFNRQHLWVGFAALVALGYLGACGSTSADSTGGTNLGTPTANNSGMGGAASNGGNNNGSFQVATGGAALAPETKVELAVEVPQASPRYVYAANPDRDSVAIIDPSNLGIQTVAVDSAPHGLKTVPNQDAALVVNTGSSTVSVLRTTTVGANSATNVTSLAVMSGSNVASVAPDGKHAVVYYDSSKPTDGPPTDSPQNMSVVDLSTASPVVYQVTVGYHPTSVTYSTDSSKAFVVSDDGVSKIDLATVASVKSRVAEMVHLYDATVTTAAKVTVVPDGDYAIAQQPGAATIRLVDLTSKSHQDINLGALFAQSAGDAGAALTSLDVSDVEVSPAGDFLLAVIRDRGVVLRVPIPDGFDDTSVIERISLPSVLSGVANIDPKSHYAVLYTTIDTANEQRVSIVDLGAQNAVQVVNLHKSVHAVTFDPTGKRAYVLHSKSNGDPNAANLSQDQITARSYAYSVVDLASGASRLQLTTSQPGPIAALPDGSALFVLLNAASPWEVQRFDLAGFAVDHIGIGSQPTGIGFVEKATQIFVSQAHVDGRMTFIDWTNISKVKSVTGYELNSSIWE